MHLKTIETLVVGAVIALAAAAPAGAQWADTLPAGARVRVLGIAAGERGDQYYHITGTAVGSDSNHLFVREEGRGAIDTLPYFAVLRLEAFRGRVSRRKMILISTAAGMFGGAVLRGAYELMGATDTTIKLENRKHARRQLTIAIPVLGAAGALFGTLVGLDNWAEIHLPHSSP